MILFSLVLNLFLPVSLINFKLGLHFYLLYSSTIPFLSSLLFEIMSLNIIFVSFDFRLLFSYMSGVFPKAYEGHHIIL